MYLLCVAATLMLINYLLLQLWYGMPVYASTGVQYTGSVAIKSSKQIWDTQE